MSEKTAQVIFCVGAGGVGKTSVSAMLGFYYAQQHKKVLVLTIDPAKRLLDALSLSTKSNEAVRVEHPSLKNSTGQLFALVPNLKNEWMDFLEASVKKSEAIHQISNNPFFTYMADGLPGSLEIICAHLVHRLLAQNIYDILIIDTPPFSNSLSFFDIPEKLIRVLEHRSTRLFLENRNSFLRKITRKMAMLSGNILVNTLEKIIGSNFLSEVIDFALGIDAIYEPMLTRARLMSELLKSPHTRFVLVSRASSASVADSLNLQAALKKRGIEISEVVVNQMWPRLGPGLHHEVQKLENEAGNMALLEKIIRCYGDEYDFQQKLVQRIKNFFVMNKVSFLHLAHGENLLSEMLRDYLGNNDESIRN